MPSNLSTFGLGEMLRCSLGVRNVAQQAPTMEFAARRICQYFYDELVTPSNERACALVRCYKTHPYGDLPHEIQRVARRALTTADHSAVPNPDMRCLTLLASSGREGAWNDRRTSKAHQAIPLASPQIVERAPMIAHMLADFGVPLSEILKPASEGALRIAGRTYGVFHVAEAKDNPSIPAQAQFVQRYGIESVVGFGGVLPMGELFAMILFSYVPVSAASADRFRTVALDVKGCFVRFDAASTFDSIVPPPHDPIVNPPLPVR